jgi:nucleotide-binding universal stress UspA family protein
MMSAKILCPTDGTDHSMVGVTKAAELARLTGRPLRFCVVNIAHGGVKGPTISHWTPDQVREILDLALTKARGDGVAEVDAIELIAREPGPAIVAYADQEGFDQIVMGTGDKQGLKRLVLGSVAASVAGTAHCSVLVARAG